MNGAGLSPARRLAHAELARLNLERFEREKTECQTQRDDDTVTIRFRMPERAWTLAIRLAMDRQLDEFDDEARRRGWL